MHIKHLRLYNFKRFCGWYDLPLNESINILVGANEIGKSTIIEAINLALSGFYQGKYIRNDINQYLFNRDAVEEYIASVQSGTPIAPPEIIIELYFDSCPEMNGNHNSSRATADGLYYKICFNDEYIAEYQRLVESKEIYSLPIEYYKVVWRSFHRTDITSRSIPYKASLIDSSAQYRTATDMYVSHIIKNHLEEKDKVTIASAYRKAQQSFIQNPAIEDINGKLSAISALEGQILSLSVDMSSRRSWEEELTAYIDKVPFQFMGKGTQAIVKTKLSIAKHPSDKSGVLLIEEPENHLTYSKLNQLIHSIRTENAGHQIIVVTHSSFVLNKLGLSSLVLMSQVGECRLDGLSTATQNYFQKLAGYDTLRLLLCRRAILVEGDSDELVVQRAYQDVHGCLPIEDGVDVICLRGLTFLRFLEIAKLLKLNVCVVTDNDGRPDKVREKYVDYIDKEPNIKICFDECVDTYQTLNCTSDCLADDFNFNTLEPKLLKENGLAVFQRIYGQKYDTIDSMLRHLHANKNDVAFALFETGERIKFPEFIMKAVNE